MSNSRDCDGLEICNAGDYGSEFEYDTDLERSRKKRTDLAVKQKAVRSQVPKKTEVTVEYNKEESRKDLFHLLSLDAYTRHKKFINDYLLYYGGSRSEFQRDSSHDKTDFDVIRDNHKFLWDEDDDDSDWGRRLAKKYHDKLFKEYCIADLSRYKENKIALRWRIEAEVVSGKGQFACGAKRCEEMENLRSWEVNFGYVEHGEKKNALVKLRLCPECSYKLNYHHKKREIKAKRKAAKDEKEILTKRKKSADDDDEATDRISSDKTDLKPGTTNAAAAAAAAAATAGSSAQSNSESTDDANVWSKPVTLTEEKSREDEFDEYFEDLFL